MKTLILPLLLLLPLFPARAADDAPQIVTVRIINPVGPRWVVEKDGAEIWLGNPPAKEWAPLVARMKRYAALKDGLAKIEVEKLALSRELDELNERWHLADSQGRRGISYRESQIRTRTNELRRQQEVQSKNLVMFVKANGGQGDPISRPAANIVARDTGQRQHNREVWQYLGAAPKDPDPE